MTIHKKGELGIYFGNASSCPISSQDTQFRFFCESLRKSLSVSSFILQNQTHWVAGRFIRDSVDGCELLEVEGDYLATNQKEVALGVLTADCLPIILYDSVNRAIAVLHAGWRGSVAGIVAQALKKLIDEVGAKPVDLQVFFGPAARSCCYEVQQDFCDQLEVLGYGSSTALVHRDGKTYFDKSLFNKQILTALGVKPENINEQYNVCTMCTSGFHSFRLQGKEAGRQITCVWLCKR